MSTRCLKCRSSSCSVLMAALLGGCASPGTYVRSFDKCPVGTMPKGWSIHQTNPSTALAKWELIEDATAPSGAKAFALTETKNRGQTFNLAIDDASSFKDLDLCVAVKGVSGVEDQGGGPIWRCRDENNYYICRFNPLEANYRVYCVADGKRRQLRSAAIETKAGQWYQVRVVMTGNQITCYLDGEKYLEVTDDSFPDAGKVGFWTKADAATVFDDLKVAEIKPKN